MKMFKKHFSSITLGLVLVPGVASAQFGKLIEIEEPLAATAHVERAREIAGDDLKFLSEGLICLPAEKQIPFAVSNIPGFLDPGARGVEPFAAFDNLYYIGQYAVGTWVLDTGDGLILFDALNSERDVKTILLPGMAKFGLDPRDIKYLVITHGHFDHYGGARYIQDTYGPRVIMSKADWDNLPNDIAMPFAIKAGYPAITQPKRDWEMEDGYQLEVGESSVTFIITPGHTPGTLSSVMNVKDKGEDRMIAMWGGNALQEHIAELLEMHDSLHKFWGMIQERNVEALISTHPFVVGNLELNKRKTSDGRSPQVVGTKGVDRIMAFYDECISAQFARSNTRQILSGDK